MDRYKFRAYIKRIQWVVPVESINFALQEVEVDLTSGNGDTAIYGLDEVELMQYTGLKDSTHTEQHPNGVEIYVGDILKISDRFNNQAVYFDEDGFYCTDEFALFELKRSNDRSYEVIGNIHDNPELLEG